jgi:large subunit ribosomal protein L3
MVMKERKLGLLGRKVGMTRVYEGDNAVPVTVLEVGPCRVLAKRTLAADGHRADGYSALQLGFSQKPERKVNQAEAGHLAKAGGVQAARRFVREVRVTPEAGAGVEVGQDLTVLALALKPGDLVDVTGTSKGKGFQGVMRRHNFHGFPGSHGTHEYFRHGGSIGCRKWPGRVFKGRKMPGHMGDERVTVQNLRVVAVRPEDSAVLVEGAVPGANGGYVTVRPAIKRNPVA